MAPHAARVSVIIRKSGFLDNGANQKPGEEVPEAAGLVLFLTVAAEICRAAALRDAMNRMTATATGQIFAVVNAKNFFEAMKPPFCIAKIRRRMQAAF